MNGMHFKHRLHSFIKVSSSKEKEIARKYISFEMKEREREFKIVSYNRIDVTFTLM